jgi:hypothetical protein
MNSDFIKFDSEIHTVEHNILHHRNIISPFSNFNIINDNDSLSEVFIDKSYGYAYDDYFLKKNAALYGQLHKLPEYSGDSLSNYGFLRVPFRKIPRVWVNNLLELNNIIKNIESLDKNLVIHLRGQPQEYYLNRSKQTLSFLYNDENALEPSLLTSASRKNLRLQDILPAWTGIVNLYIENLLDDMETKQRDSLSREIVNFQSGSNFILFCLSLAQHYGLPSAGLDVSQELDVALFFAFKRLKNIGNKHYYQYLDNEESTIENPPVIYVMAPVEAQQFKFEDLRPSILPFLRPDAQKAAFMHTGWGFNQNFAATRLFLAIYLNPKGDFGKIKRPEQLFPVDDDFADTINSIRMSSKDAELLKFLESFYIIASK